MRAILLALILLLSTGIKSQTASNEKALYVLVSSLTTSMKTSAEAIGLAGEFEEIKLTDPSSWLPSYYTAYCYIMAAFMETNPNNIDSLALKSKIALDKAELIAEDKSEIYCLRSLIASAQIMVDPNTRGMKYGMESSQMMAKAKVENPGNPRIYLIEGQGLLYMPAEYGGGCKNAIPVFEVAIIKYQSFKPKSALYPNWGKEEAVKLLEKCKSN